jgi:spore maturation protein B
MKLISIWAIPLFILIVLICGEYKGVKVYESFIKGAQDGMKIGFQLFPLFLAIFGGLAVFNASGALELLCRLFLPLTNRLGIPAEILPLGLIKPLSGSGAIGYTANLVQKHGPDSFLGTMASIVAGCSETTFYVITVYLGVVGITRPKHLVLMGLLGDLVSFLVAIMISRQL